MNLPFAKRSRRIFASFHAVIRASARSDPVKTQPSSQTHYLITGLSFRSYCTDSTDSALAQSVQVHRRSTGSTQTGSWMIAFACPVFKLTLQAGPVVTDSTQADPVVTVSTQAKPVVTDSTRADPVVTVSTQAEPVVTDSIQAGPVVTDSTQADTFVTVYPQAGPGITVSPQADTVVTVFPQAISCVTDSTQAETFATFNERPIRGKAVQLFL